MPRVPGLRRVRHVRSPPSLTGGDTFDLALLDQGLLVVLGDATGHGIAPGAVGDADAGDAAHGVPARRRPRDRVHAGEQPARRDAAPTTASSPRSSACSTRRRTGCASTAAARGRSCTSRRPTGACARYKPTSFPLGAMPLAALRPAVDARDAARRHPGAAVRRHLRVRTTPTASSSARSASRRSSRAHHGEPMAELCAALLDAVRAFARGAPQEDDMTIVLVKREATPRREHAARSRAASTRSPDDLRVHRRTSSPATGSTRAPADRRFRGGGAVHEHGQIQRRGATPAVRIDMAAHRGGVEVTLTDYDVEPFDVTQAPDADITCRSSSAGPGGLGLHLIRRLVDSIEYEYSNGAPAKPDHVSQDDRRRHGGPARHRATGGERCWRLNSARTARSSITAGWTPPSAPAAQAFLDKVAGHRHARLQRARVHLQRRAGRAPEDPEAAARRRPASCGSPASTATCRTSSSTPASTRSSRSSPRR